ncbi:MAG: alpha/beta fold hydrolase [Gammaproteobacteria bacterium]
MERVCYIGGIVAYLFPHTRFHEDPIKVLRVWSCTMIDRLRRKFLLMALVFAFILGPISAIAQSKPNAVVFGSVDIGNGITLHYAEQGTGVPIIFVHGSLSDYSYWRDQVIAFSKNYRAIAYSRRYNYPNHNPAVPGNSAITDADDLAAFIKAMHLGKVYVIGHSYGALTGLFLAIKHPEMIRALVLTEPPAISLLQHLPGKDAKMGEAMYNDIQRRMVAPMKAEFAKGHREAGVSLFIDYVFNDPQAWRKWSAQDRADTMKNAHEWDVMMTTGTLFPYIDLAAIHRIRLPVLIMSGGKSYPFLALIDRELARLIPNSESVVFPDDGHQMWYQSPVLCRQNVEAFFRAHAGMPPHDSATPAHGVGG